MENQHRRISLREELLGYTRRQNELNVSKEIQDEFDFINHRRKNLSEPTRAERPLSDQPQKRSAAPAAPRKTQHTVSENARRADLPPKNVRRPEREKSKGQPVSDEAVRRAAPAPRPNRATRQGAPHRKPGNVSSDQEPRRPDAKIHPNYARPYQTDLHRSEAEKKRRAQQNKHRPNEASAKLLSKTKTQTKNYRHEQRKKEIFNENTAEINRRIRMQQQFRIRQRQNVMKVYFARFLVTAVLFILLFSVFSAAFFISLPYHADKEDRIISYRVGFEKDVKAKKLNYSTLVRDGVMYIRGDDIVSLCNMTIVADVNEVKYISSDRGNETVRFVIDTATAYVNKNQVRMSAPAFYENNIFYIPLDFFTAYANGLHIGYDEEKSLLYAERIITNEKEVASLGVAPVYEPIDFTLKSSSTIPAIDEITISDIMGEINYKTDITAFEKYINPDNIYTYLTLVNHENPASATMTFNDLTDVTNKSVRVGQVQLRLYAQKALEAMLAEAKANGITRFAVFDGYRTMESLQADIDKLAATYTGITPEAAQEKAKRELGDPRESDKLLGLTADVYFGDKVLSYADSDVYRWFEKNAHKFGFVIRYPDGKADITGVGFSPWTLRFVGRYNATRMHSMKLSLEEYIEFLNRSG